MLKLKEKFERFRLPTNTKATIALSLFLALSWCSHQSKEQIAQQQEISKLNNELDLLQNLWYPQQQTLEFIEENAPTLSRNTQPLISHNIPISVIENIVLSTSDTILALVLLTNYQLSQKTLIELINQFKDIENEYKEILLICISFQQECPLEVMEEWCCLINWDKEKLFTIKYNIFNNPNCPEHIKKILEKQLNNFNNFRIFELNT